MIHRQGRKPDVDPVKVGDRVEHKEKREQMGSYGAQVRTPGRSTESITRLCTFGGQRLACEFSRYDQIYSASTPAGHLAESASAKLTTDPANLQAGDKHSPLGPAPAYALTSIFLLRYIRSMESAFAVLAEPSRRAILMLLAAAERTVGDLESELNLSQPAVSKHLRVLREAGFVEATIDAQRRVYRIRPEPLQEVDAWLAPFRRYWSAHVDALERHLDRIATPTHTKRESRNKR